jgi:heme-degrading monooxygenase HmoA
VSEERADIAVTPLPPYVAVIFTSRRTPDDDGCSQMAAAMDALARQQTGCLGIETVREGNGLGITVSYWSDEAEAKAGSALPSTSWRQQLGRDAWYEQYKVRIASVARDYGFSRRRESTRSRGHAD